MNEEQSKRDLSQNEGGLSRRDFLKRSAFVVGGLAVLSTPLVSAFRNRAEASPERVQAVPMDSQAKKRAWCMVIDLKKCEGCTSIGQPPQCTQACIEGHYIPKGMEWIQVYKVHLEGGGSYFMPTPCFHCESAPCVNVCPVGATYHTEEGVVLIDQRRCIGCRYCMAACPYQRRFFNWGTPDLPPQAAFMEYTPETEVPAIKGTVMKCSLCPHLMRQGKLPYCVEGCPMKALYVGDRNEDAATNGVELISLSKLLNDNNAYRYKEELNTQPRVFYLPGHGQEFGRTPIDKVEPMSATWPEGEKDYNSYPGIFS